MKALVVTLLLSLPAFAAEAPNPDRAQRALEEAVKANPDDVRAWRMLGLIYEKKGLKSQALEAWKNCADRNPDPKMKELALKHVRHLEATSRK